MRLISILTILLLLITLSCTDEPEQVTYNLSTINESLETLTINSYFNNQLIEEISLETGEQGLNCQYTFESFIGYSRVGCSVDSIVFKFSNNRGYIASVNTPSMFEFPEDSNPFGPGDKFDQVGTNYKFVINQDDFLNAIELP